MSASQVRESRARDVATRDVAMCAIAKGKIAIRCSKYKRKFFRGRFGCLASLGILSHIVLQRLPERHLQTKPVHSPGQPSPLPNGLALLLGCQSLATLPVG